MRRLVALLSVLLLLVGCTSGSTGTSRRSAHTSSPSTPSASDTSAPATTRLPKQPSFDVVAENRKPGTTDWQIAKKDQADDVTLAGFLDHDSALPGTVLKLRTTTTSSSYEVRAFRMGWYGGKAGRLVWGSHTLIGRRQPPCPVRAQNMVDCSGWPVALTISTNGWAPGLYLFKLTDAENKSKWIPLTLRSADARGKLLLVNATPTYQAYNAYGGYSLYTGHHGFADRATRVSFDRPYDRSGARLVTAGERQITSLAEKLGLPTAYATEFDIDHDPGLLDGARGAVSMSHDEYWTSTMRNAWEGARDKGTNLAFFGANASYWRIRTDARSVTSFKSASSDPVTGQVNTTAQWRQQPHPRPENSMTGMLYECFPARGALEVTEPDFWLFAGTGATKGSHYNGLVGPEVDRAYPIAGTPKTLEVAAHTQVACGSIDTTYSDMAYYTTAGGAGVFSSGSMLFAVGILQTNAPTGIDAPASAFATRVSANLLTAMAAGPMGRAHPARPNLASLAERADTGTGSGGPVG